MQQRLLLFILLTGLSIILLGSPSPSEANIITVDGICTLADAIIAANTNTATGNCPAGSVGPDTIVLDVDVSLTSVYPGSTNIGGGQSGLPDITSDITIQGGLQNGIDANASNFRHVYVASSGTLTLTGLDIYSGYLNQPGGTAYGGALYVDGSLTVADSVLASNSVDGDTTRGGAIYVGASGSLTVSGTSAIFGNDSNGLVSGDGGAIYAEGIINSISTSERIMLNSATGSGGAIYANTISSISNTQFERNEAGESGGSIFASFIDTIENSVLTDTVAFSGNGGAIAVTDGFTSISETIFESNSALYFGSGGSLWIDSTNGVTGTIIDSYFGYGCSGQDGGHIWLGSNAIVSITGTEFVGDNPCGGAPDRSGGAIYSEGNLSILDSTFRLFYGLLIYNTGGVIHNENGTLVVQDSVFEDSGALGETFAAGGVIYSVGDLTVQRNSFNYTDTLVLTSGTVKGGVIYTIGNAEISQNEFILSSAATDSIPDASYGGIIYAEGQANIVNNRMVAAFAGNYGVVADGYGGAIYLAASEDSRIAHNTAQGISAQHGEVVYASGPVAIDGNLFISDGHFEYTDYEDCMLLAGVTGSNNLNLDGDTSCNTISAGTIDPSIHMNGSLLASVFGNPAIDGNPGCGLATDGLGNPRIGACDIGYHELQLDKPTPTPTFTPTFTPSLTPTFTPTVPASLTPTDTPTATETPILPTDTPSGPTALVVAATCVDENLAVTISAGDGPFNITVSAGINTPVNGVSIGTTTINGPEKWDNLTVTETSGDGQSVNLGQFKCRTDERPVPLTPAHRERTTNPFPLFSWTAISGANNYRVFVFDDKVAANRTVDIRQNSGGATSLTLSTPLPDGRLFWRVRGRQNRVWSLWSVRFTFFKDPVVPVIANTPVPTVELEQPSGDELTPSPVPTVRPVSPFPAPPNSR